MTRTQEHTLNMRPVPTTKIEIPPPCGDELTTVHDGWQYIAESRLERVNGASGHIVIAGGSGFLGISLATHLADSGASVVVLSRGAPKPAGAWRHVSWDAR